MSPPTPDFNLLPLPRRVKRAQRRAMCRWVIGCAVVAMVSIAPAAATAMAEKSDSEEMATRIARAERAIAQMKKEEIEARTTIARLQSRSALLTVVGDRPDWRPLLHTIAAAGDDARFERIDARFARDSTGEVQVSMMVLLGSQTEARSFVLRLEDLGVFDTVMLRSTSSVMDTGMVRCEVLATVSITGAAQ